MRLRIHRLGILASCSFNICLLPPRWLGLEISSGAHGVFMALCMDRYWHHETKQAFLRYCRSSPLFSSPCLLPLTSKCIVSLDNRPSTLTPQSVFTIVLRHYFLMSEDFSNEQQIRKKCFRSLHLKWNI